MAALFTGLVLLPIFFVFLCLSRMLYLLIALQWSRADGREGEYDVVFALFPIFIRGKLVWFEYYHRACVSTLVGYFTTARLPEGKDKDKHPCEWPHLSLS